VDETDEIKGLRERLARADQPGDDLLRTIEADNWAHLRATAEMNEVTESSTARHEVPTELLESSIPTREVRAVVPRPGDHRWRQTVARVGEDGSLELLDALRASLEPGSRIHVMVFVDDD
jgi:hypothetical protein